MKKVILAWKNPECNGINPEWIELTAADFKSLLQLPENKNRRFIIVEAVDWQDDLITIEATKEQYVAWKKEYNAKSYRWARDKGVVTVSLDALTEDASDVAGALSMDAVNPEEMAINRALCKCLPKAMEALSEAERELVEMLYFAGMSGRAAAKQLGISEATLRYRRDVALHKILQRL